MTTADKIRQEILNSFDAKRFIEVVEARIKSSGEAWFICDYHVGTKLTEFNPTISVRDKQSAIDTAHKEGFKVRTHINCYGVKSIIVQL